MKTLPIYCWTDDVDDRAYAVIARCYVFTRGSIYGLSVFVLVDQADINRHYRSEWTRRGEEALKRTLAVDHGGRLPWCCTAQNGKEIGLG